MCLFIFSGGTNENVSSVTATISQRQGVEGDTQRDKKYIYTDTALKIFHRDIRRWVVQASAKSKTEHLCITLTVAFYQCSAILYHNYLLWYFTRYDCNST